MRPLLAALFLVLGGSGAAASVMPGDPAPGFTLEDVNSASYSLADFAGKVVLIAFVGYG